MLKKISYETKRLADIKALYSALLNVQFDYYEIRNISQCLDFLYVKGFTVYKDLKTITLNKYGTDDSGQNAIEQKYVEILTILFIFIFCFEFFKKNNSDFYDYKQKEILNTLNKHLMRLHKLFPEFILQKNISELDFTSEFLDDFLPKYQSNKTKIAYDNLKNVPKEKAEPIALLLNPNLKTSIEIIGAITTVYNQIDKISQNQLIHLSKEDQTIFVHSQKYLKLLANKSNIRHKNTSSITKIAIKDLSILIGSTAALLQKLQTKSSK